MLIVRLYTQCTKGELAASLSAPSSLSEGKTMLNTSTDATTSCVDRAGGMRSLELQTTIFSQPMMLAIVARDTGHTPGRGMTAM